MKQIIFYFDPNVSGMFIEEKRDDGKKYSVLSSPNNFVFYDEIVARVVDIDNPDEIISYIEEGYNYYNVEKYIPFKAAKGILFDESSLAYTASEYGFVIFNKRKSEITLHPPLQITRDRIKAYYIIHPTKFKKIPSYGDISEVISMNQISAVLDKDSIENQLSKIDVNTAAVSRITVAAGQEPVNGYNEYLVPLIDVEKKAGKEQDDGSIDFKEIGSIINVKKGQEILKKIPAKEPEHGCNIKGEKIEAVIVGREGYTAGDNIVESSDKLIYVSALDGCIEIRKKKISVLPFVFIKDDVNYETGNIDFNGSVQIAGSVMPGFSVKATGDITVGQNIDDAIIEAGGNLTVTQGIGGKGSTDIIAGGMVKAKFILNSNLQAMGEIEIEDSIINSRVFSNEKITVTAKHGKIIGGETMALYEIAANVSGAPNGTKTILTVGKSLYIERELNIINEYSEVLKSKVEDIIEYINVIIGKGLFNNPKIFVTKLEPAKRKLSIELVKILGKLNKQLKKVVAKHKEEEEKKYIFEREPVISVLNKVYPGTVVKIKNMSKIFQEELSNVKLLEDSRKKVIKYTSAV